MPCGPFLLRGECEHSVYKVYHRISYRKALMSKLLSKDEWDIVSCIEQLWTSKGKFPSLRTISNMTKITQVDVSNALKNPVVQLALENRGIDWNPVSSDKLLTGEQIATINTLLDITDKRTTADKLKSLGVSRAKFKGWQRSPKFMEAYREAAENLYGESLPEIHRSLIQEAVNGSFAHQKLVLAMTGRWDERRQNEQMNVRYVLMKVLEIIQTHVSDAETLNKIAGEFEAILNPETPAITQAQPVDED